MRNGYDPQVPLQLKKIQQWFAGIITRPIQDNSQMLPLSPKGILMEKEAKKYIAPSPTMEPHHRIELYNQQYWWRLLSSMHDIYPLVTRLFGYYHFNQLIAIPYLLDYPPNHWSLNLLGSHLDQWVSDRYDAKDKSLVYDAVRIDWAFNTSFTAEQLPSMDLKNHSTSPDLSSLVKQKIYLQRHVCFFELGYDLFDFRQKFIKEDGDYWIEHDFPPLIKERKYFFLLYRNRNNLISWKEVSHAEFFLLNLFRKGTTIERACVALERENDEIVSAATKHLHEWFQEWIIRNWFSLEKPRT